LAEGAGSSPPDNKSKAGAAYANPGLCSAPDTAVSGSLVSCDPPNMGHLTNGWAALTALYSLLRDLRAGEELPRPTRNKGVVLCLEWEGFELEGLYSGVRKRVRNIDKRIFIRDCEELRRLTES